jgi:putative transposase
MQVTYRYRLYPTKSQKRLLEATVETCRRWYNACLEERKSAWDERHENIGKYAQLRKVKDHRREDPCAAQLHSHILQVTTCDLDKAFQAFFRRHRAAIPASAAGTVSTRSGCRSMATGSAWTEGG